jgi:hypothetical protein
MQGDREPRPEPAAHPADDGPPDMVVRAEPDILFSRGYRGASLRDHRLSVRDVNDSSVLGDSPSSRPGVRSSTARLSPVWPEDSMWVHAEPDQ